MKRPPTPDVKKHERPGCTPIARSSAPSIEANEQRIHRSAVPNAKFIARQRTERAAAGLGETIADADTLRLVAALVVKAVTR